MDTPLDFSKLSELHPDLLIQFINAGAGWDLYPVDRPPRPQAAPAESRHHIHLEQPKQMIRGLGFEIMADSIGSGNVGLPDEPVGVPHDLVPAERARLAAEMLAGFRYCRLAGGLFWRGLDPEQKYLRPRWPEQLAELRDLLTAAGVEGVSLEYWSPAPFWKANRAYVGNNDPNNRLRCFGADFAQDPEYHGDVDRFLADFAQACRQDLATLRAAGIPVSMWGLQAEPFVSSTYPACLYQPADYARTFTAVAPQVRAFDSHIQIIADTSADWNFPFVRSVLNDRAHSALVDALAIHLIGFDSRAVRPPAEPSGKPRFNNEFEYLHGPATPARCLNTVQSIMNWFQLTDAPTWFWLHALKPFTNAEASGYSLGYWRPSQDAAAHRYPPGLEPGHWIWNKYNWHAVGSFVRHMPWDCRSVAVTEADGADDDLRLCAFERPNGLLTVALSNRSFAPHTFRIDTGLAGSLFTGYRYTPESAGANGQGVALGMRSGPEIAPTLPDMTWEFWEQVR